MDDRSKQPSRIVTTVNRQLADGSTHVIARASTPMGEGENIALVAQRMRVVAVRDLQRTNAFAANSDAIAESVGKVVENEARFRIGETMAGRGSLVRIADQPNGIRTSCSTGEESIVMFVQVDVVTRPAADDADTFLKVVGF